MLEAIPVLNKKPMGGGGALNQTGLPSLEFSLTGVFQGIGGWVLGPGVMMWPRLVSAIWPMLPAASSSSSLRLQGWAACLAG
jgi:hypothetical protein